uniref:Uncharacterized protein n=1 Tax=Panagrolaimus sp. JU765 TaxID=591449 RepID=A0AC34QQ55_9BILA
MSRRSKFALEETLVAITPLQLDPAHADEIIQIARQAPSLQSGSENDIDGIHILRFKTLVELYHDDPSLLDKILVELVDCLISQVVLSENPEDLLNQSSIMSLILLKVVTVVRGYKTIIRLLPHEVYLLPKLLALLENYSKLEKFTELEYEAICMLLVWFMIVCRNPFDFNLFAQEDEGKRHELAKYGTSIIQSLDSYLNLEMNNSNAKLQMVKLIQRIGLIYLKPKPANWRYKCGVRSLEENLKIVEPKMENISQETDEVAELDPETQKLIDTILKSLLIGIQDKENNVRTSAAKGI